MSIELYLQGFSDGEPSGIPEAAVRTIFSISSDQDEDGRFLLDFGPGMDCELIINIEAGVAVAVTIFRPVTAVQLWTSVFELMSRGNYVAYTSEGRAAVATAAVRQEMPPEMVESFADIAEVASAAELVGVLFE